MLVTMDPSSGPQSRAPSIMDSPTLARVERARIRLEAQALNNNENHSLERRILDPKVSQLPEIPQSPSHCTSIWLPICLIRRLTH